MLERKYLRGGRCQVYIHLPFKILTKFVIWEALCSGERVVDITDPIYYRVETFPEILTVAVFEPIPTVIVP